MSSRTCTSKVKYFFNCRGLIPRIYVFDDHDQEGQFDGEGLFGVHGAGDVVGAHVGSHNFEDRRLNVGIGDSLNVAVTHILVPNLEGLGTIAD